MIQTHSCLSQIFLSYHCMEW